MKAKKNYAKKIKTKDLKTKLYSGVSERFIPPQDYRTNIRLLHHCRYCKKFKLTKELSIYDGKLIYVCPECGGRHKYSTFKISFHKFLKMLCLLFVAFCMFVVFVHARGDSIYDMFNSYDDTPEYNYDVLTKGDNSSELDGEVYKEFLFVVPKDGYYKFNSLSTCEPEDVNGKLIIDGEVVCENDNFENTKSFYMLKYLEKGQEVILAVDAHDNPITRFDVQIRELSKKEAWGVELYIEASTNGYEVSSSKDVYYEPSFYSDYTNYKSSDVRFAKTFRIEEDESYVWLAFGAENSSGKEFQVWCPVKIEE